MEKNLFELFQILVRYLLLLYAGYLLRGGFIGPEDQEIIIGLGLTVFTIVWMLWYRFWSWFKNYLNKDKEEDPMDKIQDAQ